jgi:arylsulfatase A-like enzyme
MAQGSFTLWAHTIDEGYTVPSHVSMLTGTTPARHGVTWDGHIEGAYPNVPTIFELAKNAGHTTAMVAGKTKFVVFTKPGTLDWVYIAHEGREGDEDVARRAAGIIRAHRPDVMFVHLGQVDVIGHEKGWGSVEQLRAVDVADRALGTILRALRQVERLTSTFVVVTSDHGGEGFKHDPDDPRSQFIPWIVAGPSIRRNFDLTSVPGLTINTMSTFATACLQLGIEPSGEIDGRAVREVSALTLAQ